MTQQKKEEIPRGNCFVSRSFKTIFSRHCNSKKPCKNISFKIFKNYFHQTMVRIIQQIIQFDWRKLRASHLATF